MQSSRAINLEILPNQSAQDFIIPLKQLIVRRGRASVVYSDNVKTFVEPQSGLVKDEKCKSISLRNRYLIRSRRAPWYDGQFKRMVGLVKQSLFKATTPRTNLTK